MAYTWMWRDNHAPLYVSLAGGALTLNFAGGDAVTFDGEGRLVTAWLDRVLYRRALDNRVLAKRRLPNGRRERRFLDTPARRAVLTRAYALAARVREGLARSALDPQGTPASALDPIRAWLTRVAGWTWERLEGERERFYRVYAPVPILPPDQYLAVVVQVTEGCSYNRCTFCTFYRGRPFRIKGPEELARHLAGVKTFLGRGLAMRRSVFLADANAIVVPQERLLPLVERVRAAFPDDGDGPRGLYAFVSAPDALRKTPADFAALRERGLRRVYVGLETGHDPLRAFILKQGRAADVLHAVRTIRQGGVHVGVICLVGIGGARYREAHFRDTVALVQDMPLSAGDMVYLSPFVASPEAPYVYDAAEAGIRPLSEQEIEADLARFRQALLPWARKRGVRVSTYDIREFVY